MNVTVHLNRQVLLLIIIFFCCSCAGFNPQPMDEVPFQQRAQTQTERNIRVTAAVPSAEESKALFDVNLYKKGIQPIWLEIENNYSLPVVFLPISVDRNYYTPIEAAWANHFANSKNVNEKMDHLFYERGTDVYIEPGEVLSGFVFTNLDEGTKGFTVDLIADDTSMWSFLFFIPVPGLKLDHHAVDIESLYSKDEIVDHNMESLRQALERIPCCVANKKGTEWGDPMNLVVIGDPEDVYHAFIHSGWDETEAIYGGSAWKTGVSFMFGGRYRYSPISSLYAFGRRQDVAFQKARETIHERNHLRLWNTPMRIDGKPVWVGQISRDIGVRFTTKTITTHKIDPDVDETREFLLQDLWYSQALKRFAYVKGVVGASFDEPRHNLTGDPYFTDGLRIVMWVSSTPVSFENVDIIEWEFPIYR